MRVSVIMPCYNSEDTVNYTLESLEKQTYKDFELIVVDDGSTDNTYQLLEEWKQSGKIQMIITTQKNSGVSSARNKGIELSNSEFITFIDSDDQYSPDFLELLVDHIQNDDVDMVCSRFIRSRAYKEFENNQKKDYCEKITRKEFAEKVIFNKRLSRINFCCCLYKKEIIDKYLLQFPLDISYGEDNSFLCKYACHCGYINVLDLDLYLYKINPASVTNKISYKKVESILAHQEYINYWKENGYPIEKSEVIISRVIWAIAKDFALQNMNLYKKFISEYDVKNAMKIIFKESKETIVKVTSFSFLVNKYLFCICVKIGAKMKN